MSDLSPRQKEIVLWVCEGKTASEIALILGLSTQTVKNHLTEVRRTLELNPVALIVRYAIRKGWIKP